MAIADTLHIPPWDIRDQLTVGEFRVACAYIDRLNEQAEEATQK